MSGSIHTSIEDPIVIGHPQITISFTETVDPIGGIARYHYTILTDSHNNAIFLTPGTHRIAIGEYTHHVDAFAAFLIYNPSADVPSKVTSRINYIPNRPPVVVNPVHDQPVVTTAGVSPLPYVPLLDTATDPGSLSLPVLFRNCGYNDDTMTFFSSGSTDEAVADVANVRDFPSPFELLDPSDQLLISPLSPGSTRIEVRAEDQFGAFMHYNVFMDVF